LPLGNPFPKLFADNLAREESSHIGQLFQPIHLPANDPAEPGPRRDSVAGECCITQTLCWSVQHSPGMRPSSAPRKLAINY
jgi:hypothetical protein